jgi:hypothetical protein
LVTLTTVLALLASAIAVRPMSGSALIVLWPASYW